MKDVPAARAKVNCKFALTGGTSSVRDFIFKEVACPKVGTGQEVQNRRYMSVIRDGL